MKKDGQIFDFVQRNLYLGDLVFKLLDEWAKLLVDLLEDSSAVGFVHQNLLTVAVDVDFGQDSHHVCYVGLEVLIDQSVNSVGKLLEFRKLVLVVLNKLNNLRVSS